MKRPLATIVATFVLVGMLVSAAAPAGVLTKAQLSTKLLSLSNMPAGWTAENSGGGRDTYTGCLKSLRPSPKGPVSARAFYADDGYAPAVGEALANGRAALVRFGEVNRLLSDCKALGGTAGGVRITGTVSPMSFPDVGSHSSAYAVSLTYGGFKIEADVITFEVGEYFGEILYEEIGQPNIGQVESFVNEAIAKIEGRPTTPPENIGRPGGTLN